MNSLLFTSQRPLRVKVNKEPVRTQRKKTSKRSKARENESNVVVSSFDQRDLIGWEGGAGFQECEVTPNQGYGGSLSKINQKLLLGKVILTTWGQ